MIDQCATTLAKGTAAARKGKAEATTTRLIALFEDNGLQRAEAKRADQQRQQKLGTAEADQPAKRTNDRAAAKGRGCAAFWVFS